MTKEHYAWYVICMLVRGLPVFRKGSRGLGSESWCKRDIMELLTGEYRYD